MSEREVGIECYRALEHLARVDSQLAMTAQQRTAAQVVFVGIAADGATAAETRRVAGDEAHLERARDLLRNLVLDREHVFEPAVERFGPQVITVAGTDELRGHAQAITELAHAPFEDRCDAERSTDLARRRSVAPCTETRRFAPRP